MEKLEDLLTEGEIEKVTRFAMQGMTEKQIYQYFNIKKDKLSPQDAIKLDELILVGNMKGIQVVTAALIKNVQEGHPASIHFYLKNVGWGCAVESDDISDNQALMEKLIDKL